MRPLFICFLTILLFAETQAQNRDTLVNVSNEIKALVSKLDSCSNDKNKDCLNIANSIVKKGEKEGVPYLDYLYFKKAYYFWKRNMLDSTLFYSKLAIENPHPVERQRSDIDAHNLAASVYYHKGNLDKAIEVYIALSRLLEDGGNPLHLGYLYSNIGILLGTTNNNEQQIAYSLKSYKLLKENNDTRYIATVASNLGFGHYYKRDTLEAINWAKKAYELSSLSNDMVAKTQSKLVLSYLENDLDLALNYVVEAVKYADSLGDKTHQTNAYNRYADVLHQMGQGEKAFNYAAQAVDLATAIGDNTTLRRASKTAGIIAYELAKKEKAADFYNTYIVLNDSISNIEKTKEINEIYTKFETEKKEKQLAEQALKIQKQRANLLYAILGGILLAVILGGIVLYSRKAQKLKLKQLQQEKENAILSSFILGEERERKRISHELHDGVAAMIGAAKMTLESIPHLAKEKQKEHYIKVQQILESTHTEVRYIAHNLLPTVLEKEGLIKATMHFAEEINKTKLVFIEVVDNTNNTQKLSPQLELMLFRVIQELVNNIIKHSEAQNAKIIFSNKGSHLKIEITDDGIGYDDQNTSGKQGLYSISKRLKSIGGNFVIRRKTQGGTEAMIELNSKM